MRIVRANFYWDGEDFPFYAYVIKKLYDKSYGYDVHCFLMIQSVCLFSHCNTKGWGKLFYCIEIEGNE